MNEVKVYCISGLGADQRVFQGLDINHELIPLPWIPPMKEESLQSYAHRLAAEIDKSNKVILLGVSFGGMIAVEIGKILDVEKTIIISSAETASDLGWKIGLVRKLGLIHVIPHSWLRPPSWLAVWIFGARNKKLLRAILKDTDTCFAKWAMKAVLSWRNQEKSSRTVKICGTKDRVIPPASKGNTYLIKGGSHFMIVDKAHEVSAIINEVLEASDE